MKKITSFTVNHLKLLPGLYVSRKDEVGGNPVTTFDIRITRPNEEPVMNTAEVHTIEHLGATFLRNHAEYDRKTCVDLMQEACRDAGPIVFITAAGGALGAVINATGAAKMMADAIVAAGVPGILVPIIIGVIMRFPQGSGTTAMITGSAIIAPMISTLNINPYLAALSLCLTTMCPSYLNDSYFHVVTNFSGMDIKTSLKTWTIGSILVPAFGSAIFCILSIFIH